MTVDFRYVCAMYCDDIREEVDHKTSLMGWNQESRVWMPAEGPIHLPQLCILLLINIPRDPPARKMLIDLMLDEKVFRTLEPPDGLLAGPPRPPSTALPNLQLSVQAQVAIKSPNFSVAAPCKIWARVTIDGTPLHSNPLTFERKTADASPVPSVDI